MSTLEAQRELMSLASPLVLTQAVIEGMAESFGLNEEKNGDDIA